MNRNVRLRRLQQRSELPLAGAAVLFLILYSVEVLAQPRDTLLLEVALWCVYALFLGDYLLRLYLARPRWKWFFRHLFDLAIVLLPFLRPLRLLSLAVVVKVLQRTLGNNIRGRVVLYTVFGATVIIYTASLAVLEVEHDAPGATITSFGNALWWAMTTVTTVGYGDLYPVTVEGRVVAAALMIGGISLVGVVTATLASWIIQRVAEEDAANQTATVAHIQTLHTEIRHLREALNSTGEPVYGDRVRADRS